MSAARLTLAEVDQLIDQLDRASPERGDWRAAFDRLHNAFMRARRFDHAQGVFNVLMLGVILYSVVRLVQVNWDFMAISAHELNLPVLSALLLMNLYQFALSRVFPVLRRRDRVAAQLRFFGADIPDERAPPERTPPEVALALVELERAKSPIGLRPAYETVEKWQLRPRRWDFGAIQAVIFWLVALVVALNSDVPDFWRGAAFMLAVVIALHAMGRRISHVNASERLETALGRWRHLVPAMRDTP